MISLNLTITVPVVEVSIGNFTAKAHIDSGNMVGGFIVPTSLVDKLTLASQPVTVGRGHTVSNEVEIKEARLSENIKLGSFEFSQPTITFPAIADEVNIGLKILREFSVTFDQKNKRAKFERQLPKATESTEAISSSEVKDQANDYVGNYGERTISSEGNVLYLQRQGGPKIKLVPASKDEFTLEPIPSARIRFVRDASGKVTELRVLNRTGEWEVSKKVQPTTRLLD